MSHANAQNFNRAAAAYERGRPDYPAAAVRTIVRALAIGATSTVVDLAAGTGKFTRLLSPTRAHLIAVEPLTAMRAVLADRVPASTIVAGTAEALPLAAATVDAVTVAQAFHWFQPAQATREIQRVLRPGGGLAIIWNQTDARQPLQQAIDAIVWPYRACYRPMIRPSGVRHSIVPPSLRPCTSSAFLMPRRSTLPG